MLRVAFYFLSHFLMKFFYANRIGQDGMLRFAASHLGLYYLPMYHKKDARLIWVKSLSECFHVFEMQVFS